MAGGRGVQDRDVLAVVHDFEHGGNQPACVQHDRFARLEIDLHVIFFTQIVNALDEGLHIVIVARDVVAAAEVEPLHAFHIFAEAFFKCCNRADKVVCILFAQGVEVEPFDAGEQFGLEVGLRDAEAGSGTAGVVHCMFRGLGRALGVETQAAAFARGARQIAVCLPLVERIEHNVVGVP